MRKIYVSDCTLKDLAERGSSELLFREKTAVAACIDRIGADYIELPAVKRPKEDAIICKTIASVIKSGGLAIPAGITEESVDTAWECVKTAARPCLQVILPVSTAQMEYGYRAKEKVMLDIIARAVSLAKAKCGDVEFTPLDATRADVDFLVSACNTAKENGAVRLTLCDDAGVSLPEDIASLVKKVKEACGLPVAVKLSDNISMAVAGAVAALAAGADGVKTTMAGSDGLSAEKFANAASVKGASLGIETGLKLTEIHRDINETMKKIGNTADAPADKQTTDSRDVFLDLNSTISDVSDASQLLGYELSDEDAGKVHKALMQVCERKYSVGARELEALIASYAMQAPSAYHLVSFMANCSDRGQSMAQVTLQRGDDMLNGVAIGDGPIDSAFRAIEQSVGYHYELDDFEIQAVTEGKEALGSTLVKLRNHGKLYSGTGLSTDIVGASIRAYINALNKIVYEEK